jgi:hypothetical protein
MSFSLPWIGLQLQLIYSKILSFLVSFYVIKAINFEIYFS